MRWYRHSHSYSEGELSKSASIGRASSRGQEGHRSETKLEIFPLIFCISVSSTGGSGGYHSAGSRGTSQVKCLPFISYFLACVLSYETQKGGRGSGESRKSGHSGESDAGVVRQANVFIRWEGGKYFMPYQLSQKEVLFPLSMLYPLRI